MPVVDVVDIHKQKVRSVDVAEALFGATVNGPLLHSAVVMQQACARQGTASTKTRAAVSGSGKKPWKQKHTGRARVGSIRSPIWRHGGTVFGPHPRDYSKDMTKKQYRAALQSALSAKLQAGAILVVTDLPLSRPKTGLLAKTLAQLGLTSKTLIITGTEGTDLERAARNLSQVKVIKPQNLNVYDVLRFDFVVIPERELGRLQEVWA